MLRSFGFPVQIQPLFLFAKDIELKASPAYVQAKAGDQQAAMTLLIDLAVSWLHSYRDRQAFGGVVHDVVVLVNAGRDKALVPSKKFVQLIKERFDDEFTEIFGIEPSALTANEANYLVGFPAIDGIRNRLASARKEIDRRLRSKGIARTASGQALGAPSAAGLIQSTHKAVDAAPELHFSRPV